MIGCLVHIFLDILLDQSRVSHLTLDLALEVGIFKEFAIFILPALMLR